MKFTQGICKTKESVSNLVSKLENNKKESKEDPYEEVKKLKELLDMNIITKEEFNKKKKDLLNI